MANRLDVGTRNLEINKAHNSSHSDADFGFHSLNLVAVSRILDRHGNRKAEAYFRRTLHAGSISFARTFLSICIFPEKILTVEYTEELL